MFLSVKPITEKERETERELTKSEIFHRRFYLVLTGIYCSKLTIETLEQGVEYVQS